MNNNQQIGSSAELLPKGFLVDTLHIYEDG